MQIEVKLMPRTRPSGRTACHASFWTSYPLVTDKQIIDDVTYRIQKSNELNKVGLLQLIVKKDYLIIRH